MAALTCGQETLVEAAGAAAKLSFISATPVTPSTISLDLSTLYSIDLTPLNGGPGLAADFCDKPAMLCATQACTSPLVGDKNLGIVNDKTLEVVTSVPVEATRYILLQSKGGKRLILPITLSYCGDEVIAPSTASQYTATAPQVLVSDTFSVKIASEFSNTRPIRCPITTYSLVSDSTTGTPYANAQVTLVAGVLTVKDGIQGI